MAAPDYSNFPKPMTQAEIDSMEGIVVDPNPLHIDVKVRQTLTSTSCSTLRSYSCFGFLFFHRLHDRTLHILLFPFIHFLWILYRPYTTYRT